MFKPAKYQTKLLKGIEDKGIIIHYERGSAGNLVQRVVASHDTIYWSKLINNSYISESNPLKWPEKGFIEYFIAPDRVCHATYCFIEEEHQNKIAERIPRNSEILKALKTNKIVVLQSHVDVRTLNKNIQVIRIVGDERRLRRKEIARPGRHFLQPIVEDNTYNLNINNLVDENYDIFKKEYLALCNQYNFIPNTEPVRKFILIWRSKQTFINF